MSNINVMGGGDLLLRRRMMMGKRGGGRLPEGYQEVAYLSFQTANSWIGLNIIPVNHTAEICVNDKEYVNDKHYFGGGSGISYHVTTYNNCYFFGHYFERSGGRWQAGITTVRYNVNPNHSSYVNGELIENDNLRTEGNSFVNLGSRNSANFTGDMYYFILSDYDTGEIVRDMVCCKRLADGVVGMYDLCESICPRTNTPFYNVEGGGIVIAGPNI